MRPELEDTLAAPKSDPSGDRGSAPTSGPSPSRTATSPRATGEGEAVGLILGQQLGHFRIDRPLGAGGMGEVYLAQDLALDRPVAIKVLPAAVARDPVRRDRMVREARAQARVNHPNIGHIYFIGEEAGRLYFAMEYVAGKTLADKIAEGPVGPDDALAIIRSAALGLREAQRSGITHRDIKPSNLMIDGHGMVKVLDFGLAAGGLGALGSGPVAQTSLAGTPLYMAPEQARGEPIDFHADIYALGATLFHLVSGKPPFEADTLDGLLSKHASAERPTLPRRAGTPRTAIAAIDALCNRMMAPMPADRFASYDELIRAIELTSLEHIRPAGFWVRSMATLVDLLITSMVAAAIAALAALVLGWSQSDNLTSTYVYVAYVLAGSVLTSRKGCTPGQWLFEIEVVDMVTGGRPPLGRAALRLLLPVALPLIGSVIKVSVKLFGYELYHVVSSLLSASIVLAPIGLLWASWRSLGKHTVWDHLSRTMVRYRTRRTTTI